MALWGGILPRLQSATCEALWGITKFSEDALAAVDHALHQEVGRGVVVSTVINSTLFGNVGKGAVINAVLNKTLPANGIQVGNGTVTNMFVNKTLPPQSDKKAGNVTIINEALNQTALGRSGGKATWLNAAVPHGVGGMNSETYSSTGIQENFVVPVVGNNTNTSRTTTQKPPGLFPELISKPLKNRTIPFPHPGLLPRPVIG
jgi:hypothetical protein